MASSAAITVGPHRVCFPQGLFVPNDNDNYGLMILLKKGVDDGAKTRITEMISKVMAEHWPNPDTRPRVANPIKDADDPSSTSEGVPLAEKYPETAGHWVVRASSKRKPVVYDKDPSNIVFEPSKCYGGMWMNVSVNAYTWTFKNRKGVSVGLNAAQIVKDDEPFASGGPVSAAAAGFVKVEEQGGSDQSYLD